jgi:protease-4
MIRIARRAAPLVLVLVAVVGLSHCGGPRIAPGSTLVITLDGDYAEGDESPLLARLTGSGEHSLLRLYSLLRKAELDARVERVVVRVRGLSVGWGKAQEIRDALVRVGESGRETVAVLESEGFGAAGYYVATGAERIVATPASRTPILGLAAEHLFFGDLFEKLGVVVEYERVGDYKSAVETFAEAKMSDANREMTNALLDSTEAAFVAGVAEGRALPVARVRELVDEAPSAPQQLLEAKLIDEIAYFEQVVGDAVRVDEADYAPVALGVEPAATFALVHGVGMVLTGEGGIAPTGGRVFGSDTVAEAIRDAAADDEVSAILLRIDSPGGSPLASDLVWRAIRDVRAAGKPVIASLSDVAASGGYYVASAADRIVAQPSTLTGSIGVFVLRPSLGGLLEKLGVGVETLQRGARADVLFGSRALSPGARELLQADVAGVYEQFVARVAEGRAMEPDAVRRVGGGRVWTGAQALEIGLVDELGGLYEAALAAKEATGIAADAPIALKPYPAPQTLGEQIADLMRGASVRAVDPLRAALPRELRALETMLTALPSGVPLLVPPALVVLH